MCNSDTNSKATNRCSCAFVFGAIIGLAAPFHASRIARVFLLRSMLSTTLKTVTLGSGSHPKYVVAAYVVAALACHDGDQPAAGVRPKSVECPAVGNPALPDGCLFLGQVAPRGTDDTHCYRLRQNKVIFKKDTAWSGKVRILAAITHLLSNRFKPVSFKLT